jgi:hypothetical protein
MTDALVLCAPLFITIVELPGPGSPKARRRNIRSEVGEYQSKHCLPGQLSMKILPSRPDPGTRRRLTMNSPSTGKHEREETVPESGQQKLTGSLRLGCPIPQQGPALRNGAESLREQHLLA